MVLQGVGVDDSANQSRTRIENIFGFDFASECHNTRVIQAPGFTDPVRCGFLMAGLSYLGEDLGYNALELIRKVFDDLQYDRLLNGIGTSGQLSLGDYDLDANTMRSKLARAIKQYMEDPELNKSGLPTVPTQNDIRAWLDGIAANADPIFDPNQAPWPVDIEPPVVTAHVGDEEFENHRWVSGIFRFICWPQTTINERICRSRASSDPPYLIYNTSDVGQQWSNEQLM